MGASGARPSGNRERMCLGRIDFEGDGLLADDDRGEEMKTIFQRDQVMRRESTYAERPTCIEMNREVLR